MSPEQAWQSNPYRTVQRIKLIREAQDPEAAAKARKADDGWTRKELLDFMRDTNA